MPIYEDSARDAADLAKLVNEDTDVTTRYGTNPKVSAPKAIRLIETSGTETVNQIQNDAANAIATLNTSRGFRVVGDFASGFTYELPNDVAIDGGGNYWAYADINALPVAVPAGTTPAEGEYSQRTWNEASSVVTAAGINAQQFIDNFELKIFQSPTDNLTKVTTFAGGVGVVYEVRKTSDNSLVTIYSDKDGVTSIPQNGTANVSNGDAEVVFYIGNTFEDLYIEINGAVGNFKNNLFIQQNIKEEGISTWDGDTTYPAGGLAKGANSLIYRAMKNQSGNNPTLDGGLNWNIFQDHVNIESFGAVADNVTDSTAAIDAAIDTGLPIFVPPRATGAFIYSGTKKLVTVGMLGSGNLSRIKCTANDQVFGVGLRTVVSGVRFLGNGKDSGDTLQEVLYVEQGSIGDGSRGQFLVTNNLFQDIGGTFFASRTLVNTYEGGLVAGNRGRDSNIGFNFDERGEYTTVTGNNVTSSKLACIIKGGNTNAFGNNFSGNDKGVLLDEGANDGHGNLISNVINHNTINLHAKAIQKETFTVLGNQFFVGDILLEGTVGLKVAHCDISTGDILEQGATKCYFESCNYHDNVNVVPNLTNPSEVLHLNPTGRGLTPNSLGTSNAARLTGSTQGNITVADSTTEDLILGTVGQSLPFNSAYTVQSFYDAVTGEINGNAYLVDNGLHFDIKITTIIGRVSSWDNSNVDLEVYDSATGEIALIASKGQVRSEGASFLSSYIVSGKLKKKSNYKVRVRNNSGQSLFLYGTSSGQPNKLDAWGF